VENVMHIKLRHAFHHLVQLTVGDESRS